MTELSEPKRIRKRDKNRESTRLRSRDRKRKLVELKGGKCELCGYSKNFAALHFHHKDPSQKALTLDFRGLAKATWEALLAEAEKCQLLCANCHAETHYPLSVTT